ncbi:MAG TPA: hypothetical protein VF511_06875, partial [Chthoniobacterales bacterium]
IDLVNNLGSGNNGVNPNDHCDADYGNLAAGNNSQNYPTLSAATSGGGVTNVQGMLDSRPNLTYRVEFFASPACNASGFGEGRTFLGFTTASTDGNCTAAFNATLPVAVAAGQMITATATSPGGDTSEFSACLVTAFLRITSTTKSGNQIAITGKGAPGQIYLIKANSDLSSTYETLGDTSVTDANGVWSFQDTPPSGTTRRFYRAFLP